jgi:ornithine cyclodeaminase
LILSDSDVSNILLNLSPEQCRQLISSLEEALKNYASDQVSSEQNILRQPHRSSIVNKLNDTTLVMPSSDTTNTAVKVVTLPQNGPATGAITVMERSGRLFRMLSAAQVTAFRTALAVMSLYAQVDHISKKNIVCFGSGKQVQWHIRLALLLSPLEIENITIINRGRSRLDQLAEDTIPLLRAKYPHVNFQLIAK